MSNTLTTLILTRAIAGVVAVPCDDRKRWQVAMNYSITGGQEETS